MKSPQILSTKRYDQFKRFDSNREINKNHLSRLVESIKAKNLLYLFPIVVNKQKEIVDGQHRLAAAQVLHTEVYFIIDNDVTKADIAMVNNNRKGWSAKDYIDFYRKEGHEAYERLYKLLKNYPVTIIGAVKLMRPGTAYGAGGGRDSMKLKTGEITCEEYHTAKAVCEILKPLREHVRYCFRADLTMDVKRIFIKHRLNVEDSKNRLLTGKNLFPSESFQGDPVALRILRQLLEPETHKNSKEIIDKFINERSKLG